MKRICIPLAEGFEEIEAVTLIDVLRRAGCDVKTCSLQEADVKGAHGVTVTSDIRITEALDCDWDLVVLPGGMPGSTHLRDDDRVGELLHKTADAGNYVGAVCAAPIVLGHPVKNPETIATAIRIGNPASWKQAVAAAEESGGSISIVTDGEIIDAYKLIAASEGLFVEPASAASVAGTLKLAKAGKIPDGSTVVCILTGHGLKDPDNAILVGEKPVFIPCKAKEVIKRLGY